MSGRIVEIAALSAMIAGTITTGALAADTHKELRFNLGPKAGVSVNNPYGSISDPAIQWKRGDRQCRDVLRQS